MSQVHTLPTRPACMFLNLRHLTYEIIILTTGPNSHSGLLQLSQYLAFVPQLEALELDVSGFLSYFCLPFFFPFFSAEQKATSVGLIMDGPKKYNYLAMQIAILTELSL